MTLLELISSPVIKSKYSIEFSVPARPFLKWVGGKWQLLEQMKPYFPKKFNTYFEPFVGGGAVFFYLKPLRAYLNDANEILAKAYEVLKDEPEELIKKLEVLQKRFYNFDSEAQKKMYLKVRDSFNETGSNIIERVSHLIFLNKTCFNGVYRENRSGRFNVPFGNNKKPRILDEGNIMNASQALQGSTISSGDFKDVLQKAKKGDFIYLDPPYHPVSKTSSFTNYVENGFAEEQQVELKRIVDVLDKRGCYILVSNSYTPFIKKLYQGYRFEEISANRALNCKAEGRGKIKEYLIMNY